MNEARIRELVKEHVAAEVDRNIDRVMATLCADPYYEIQPIGYRFSGIEAVREYYIRALPMFDNLAPADSGEGSGSFGSPEDQTFVGPSGLILRDNAVFTTPSGGKLVIKALSLFLADRQSNLLQGEHIYLNTPAGQMFIDALGPDFTSIPGVSVGP